MVKTITETEFMKEFQRYGRENQFSFLGQRALFEYLEEFEQSTGKQIELDVIALCVEFTEFSSFEDYQEQYGTDFESVEDLEEYTTVIYIEDVNTNTLQLEWNGAFIIQDF